VTPFRRIRRGGKVTAVVRASSVFGEPTLVG
jgi:hypothetical protein